MRIAILADSWYPAIDGVSVSARSDMLNLQAQGHEVFVHVPNFPNLDHAGGVVRPWISAAVPHYDGYAFALSPPLSFLTEARSYDLLYYHGVTPFLAYAAVAASRAFGIPFLWRFTTYVPDYLEHAQDFLEGHFRRMFGGWVGPKLALGVRNSVDLMFGTFVKLVRHIVVANDFCAEYVRRKTRAEIIVVPPRPLPPGKVNGDPLERFCPRGKRIVVLSRQSGEKNLGAAIETFRRHIHPAEPDAHLIFVGDGPERGTLEDQAAGVPNIHFAGMVPNEQVHAHLVWGDVFLYTSLSETHGLVVEEAKRGGLPIVAFDDKRGVAHQVAAADCGFLIPAGRNDALGEATVRLLRDESLRKTLGERARAHQQKESQPVRVFFPDLYL